MDDHLLRFNKNQKYLVFDLETCHLNLVNLENKPWQVGFLVCQGDNILEKKAYFIKWDKLNISKQAAIVTRFNREQYEKGGVDPKQVLDEFEKFLYNDEYKIIFHNGLNFDVYIHSIWRRNLNLLPDYSYIPRCIDTNALSKSLKLGMVYNSQHENFIAFQYKAINTVQKGLKTKLEIMGKEFGIEFDSNLLHNAIEDIKLNWSIWNYLKWKIEI